jgi:hypothetical protein
MGFRFRKSVNLGGGFRANFSKSGTGFSWGTKGVRFTKKAGGGTRTTLSIPGTGISHVSDKSSGAGCVTICLIWPFKITWWLMLGCFWLIYWTFWLVWKLFYWVVKLCFIKPIKYLYKYLKNKTQNTDPISHENK